MAAESMPRGSSAVAGGCSIACYCAGSDERSGFVAPSFIHMNRHTDALVPDAVDMVSLPNESGFIQYREFFSFATH